MLTGSSGGFNKQCVTLKVTYLDLCLCILCVILFLVLKCSTLVNKHLALLISLTYLHTLIKYSINKLLMLIDVYCICFFYVHISYEKCLGTYRFLFTLLLVVTNLAISIPKCENNSILFVQCF